MVLDKENEKIHPRYLVYDIIQFQVGVIFLNLQLISLCDVKAEQIVPLESTAEEVSFEWSHHRISSTDSKVRITY